MDEEFIIKEGKSFIIRREINGLLIEFGSFSSLANAIAFKEELEEDGFKLNNLKTTMQLIV